MATDKGTEETTRVNEDGLLRGEETSVQVIRPETRTEREKEYGKELTVEAEVEGPTAISMMDILREVAARCGAITGCRVRGEKTFEITMKDEKGKRKLLDGVRVKGTPVHVKEILNNDMVVSFINLPVYIDDAPILERLEQWGVRPISPIKRRKWPGTEIADGTRYMKVRFNEQVRSLPYSTKFETLRGAEYFRVIHDRQVRVCRLCIKPGHIFRECPDFRCFRCQKTGHYARECVERDAAAAEEERIEQMEESEDGGAEEEDAGRNGEGAEKELEYRYRTDSSGSGEKDGDGEGMVQGGEAEEEETHGKVTEKGGREEKSARERDEEQRQQSRQETGVNKREERFKKKTAEEQRLAAKRKAEEDKTRGERSKGPRAGM